MGDTGRFVGGLVGFGLGMESTTPILRGMAGKGITFRMPNETFSRLRGEYFDNTFRKINYRGPLRYAKKYDMSPENSNIGITEYELFDTLTGKSIGKMGTTYDKRLGSNGIQHVDNIVGSSGNTGVSRSLNNAALNDRPSGLISGESLVHPEITERV